MNCPLCIDQTLEIMHRHGIELDVCPKCRGIWLDRGEIDRLAAESTPPPPTATSRPAAATKERSKKQRKDDDEKKSKKKRKKSLADRLGDAIEDVWDELT